MSRRADESGQAAPLLVVVMLVVGLMISGLIALGSELRLRGRAQAVADVSALAAADDPARVDRVAASNEATVVSVATAPGGVVTVVVDLHGRRAVAAASRGCTSTMQRCWNRARIGFAR